MNVLKLHCSSMVVATAALCLWVGNPCVTAAQTRIRLATLLPQGSSQYQVLEKMGQDWRKATSGRVTLTIYAGGEMGSEIDAVRKMRIGELQAATLSVGGLSKIDPGISALQKIPMLYHSLDEEEYVRGKMTAEIEQRLEKKGFVALFWGDAGWVHIFSREAITRPDDLKKAKLFVTADDPDEAEIIKGLRLQPVPLEWSDVLMSLKTGLVDTVPTLPFLCLAGQYDLAAKHMLPLNYVVLVGATVMTKKSWDALAPADREAMRKIGAEAGKQMQIKSRAENVTAIEAMKKRGLQVHPLSPALEAEWRQFLEGVYPKVRGTMVPADMFDEIQHLIADYRTGQRASR
jgi:TRAP-type C4-dicarboxylate transport system substrate-binding protein